MRTDSFSKEKHLPVRRFIADESKVATGLYGPCAIADDLDNLFAMFDPDATFLDGDEQGGISSKNLQNGAVSYEKLGEDIKAKFQGIATEEQLSSLRDELTENIGEKADKSTTLSGYGISDAYTKGQTDALLQTVEDALGKKETKTILYEDVVNTPKWTNQPTYEGTLDSAFNTEDFYYVTLKDANGNALPSGQFMLKEFYTDGATVYPTVFTLTDLYTGSVTLVENYPVEFTSVGSDCSFRDAGVWAISCPLSNWKLGGNRGSVRMVFDGEFIQRGANTYFVPIGIVNSQVSHYHSIDSTAFQNDLTTQIIPYVPLNSIASYKVNKVFDELIIERVSDTRYCSKRNTALRCLNRATNGYRVLSGAPFGHGEIFDENTVLKSIGMQVAVEADYGFFRNGSVICVTEVK